ncbi:MAG TPA: hypothetical protein VFV38_35115 [Ktedonobacteraceae bacterium]|nr:hypothetical protein [Ktedonobacteraceae bacterium]
MSETLVLYSSHVHTRQEVEEIILEAGGVLTGQGHLGRISQDQTKHVFIWPGDEDVLGFDSIYAFLEPTTQELIRAELAGEATSTLSLEIGMTPGSGLLAVRFALIYAQHWPCVVLAESFQGEILRPSLENIFDPIELKGEFVTTVFDREDMLQLQKEGKGFIAYGM